MTLSQLEYLVAIDTYGSFGKAAEKCLVTQPTLSMQLQKLEKGLDVVLLDRSKQPVVPTEIGKKIIEQARIILREAQKVEQIIREHKTIVEGQLHIGIIPTIAPYLLPYFLGPFSKKFGDIELVIKEMKTDEILHDLRKDLLDAAILATPLHDPGIFETPLYYEEILLYLNPGHKLAIKKQVAPKELAPGDMWMLTEGNCFRDQVINLCALRNSQPLTNLKYQSGSLETLKKMVDVEGGYTLLPELAVLEMPFKEFKRIRHFKKPNPVREVSLVSARQTAKKNLLDRLSEVILENLPEEIKDKSKGHMVEWK